jgi:mono/diheme cytochrome c family protein
VVAAGASNVSARHQRAWPVIRVLVSGVLAGALSPAGLAAAAEAEPAPGATVHVDFRRDIEPILVKRCTECHGPDKQKSELRLDNKKDALKGGKSGQPLLVPGRSAESLLVQRVISNDPDEVMPAKGDRLRPEQIALLKRWIDQGAVWPEVDPRQHWAYLRPTRPAPPAVKNRKWPRNQIDYFILARLERDGLAPMPEADRATLIRRLSLDLTGLPPTPEERDAFLRDRSPAAYEKQVDRLLASPHYGEHLARWWLDLARYADSNGYQVDLARSIWPYRDWVINALNRNLPFDRFTIEQLAGDLLPQATLEQQIATGFNRNTKINDEGGGDAEEYRTKAVKDRVATTATVWLGATLACAECHSHKYDPYSQEDYYRFYAFFNNTADGGNFSVEPTVAVPAPPLQSRVAYLRARLARVQAELAAAEAALPAEQAAWERRLAGKTNIWAPLQLTNAVSTGGASFTNLPDRSILATGVNPIYDTCTVEAVTDRRGITAILLEVLPDPSLPKNGPGRWGQTGNFILDEMALSARPLEDQSAASTNLVFSRAVADWEQEYYRAEHAVDRNPKTGWAIGPKFGRPHHLIAELKEPAGFAGGTKLGFRFDYYHGNSHTIGRLRLSVSTESDPSIRWPAPADITRLLETPVAERTPEQIKELAAFYRTVSPTIRRLERELVRLNQREAELAGARYTTLVMQERAEPRETYIHVRGNFLEKGKVVSPGVPEFLPPLPVNQPPNRLALARWLMNPANPLPARVTVNRLWERFFGTGIVKTSEDLGRQGEPPSHPELLDWLATEFIRSGWDLKAVQRLLALSATYRQSAAVDATRLAQDPYNRLLSHGPRFRLDAETIRDQALAVSGLLNPEIGGPSVYPVQVANLWKEIGFLRPEIGMDEWPTSEGPQLYRRGLYTFWRRVCTYPTFATFDAPSRDVCTSRRPRTNTPLQALAALNEPAFLEAARALAHRVLAQRDGRTERQIELAFRLCLARSPTKAERRRLAAFYRQQLEAFERDPAAAQTLLQVGAAEPWPGARPAELAAWMMVANVLLNLDETLTKG